DPLNLPHDPRTDPLPAPEGAPRDIEARLERSLGGSAPTADFVAELGQRLHLAAARASAERAAAGGRRPRFWSRGRLPLAGLAGLAVLAAAGFGASRRSPAPSITAADVLRRAEQAASIPSSTSFKNYVVTEVAQVAPADGGADAEQVRSVINRWYQGP